MLPAHGTALEIASGSGQHAAALSNAFPGWQWQPSDWQADAFKSITTWAQHTNAKGVLPPVLLDVRCAQWPSAGPAFAHSFDLVYCANMMHIAPWECCAGLMQGAARYLAPHGQLVTYGPYLEDDVPTSLGNLAFDEDLRERNPAWGLRTLAQVQATARSAGLTLIARYAMPANNLLLIFGQLVENTAVSRAAIEPAQP